ncbi:MAG: glutathione binding-like protein, partial [Burkholderiales bacterium]
FRGFYRTPEPQRNWPEIRDAISRCARDYTLLDRWLEDKRYLAGDQFTIADIPAGTSLYRYFGIEIDRPSIPRVEAWYQRLAARPSYCEHVMVPFEDLRGRLAY